MLHKSKNKQKGFTLVEMSIVLVIIGLIISGILVGQDMVTNARINATAAQVTGLQTAINTFQQKYNGLPGDIDTVTEYITSLAGADGDADGVIDHTSGTFTDEDGYVFAIMAAANMVDGSYTDGSQANSSTPGTGYPLTKVKHGGIIVGHSSADGIPYFMIGTGAEIDWASGEGMTPAEALGIDTKLDDGVYNAGVIVVADDLNTAATAITTTACETNGGTTYDLLVDTRDCLLSYRAGF